MKHLYILLLTLLAPSYGFADSWPIFSYTSSNFKVFVDLLATNGSQEMDGYHYQKNGDDTYEAFVEEYEANKGGHYEARPVDKTSEDDMETFYHLYVGDVQRPELLVALKREKVVSKEQEEGTIEILSDNVSKIDDQKGDELVKVKKSDNKCCVIL